MNVWITLLLAVLPQLLAFLQKLLENGKPLTAPQRAKLAKVLQLTDSLTMTCDELGV